MLTIPRRWMLTGCIGASAFALALSAHAGAAEVGTTMAVSLTVPESQETAAFEGERFVSGTGRRPACRSGDKCAEAPLPEIRFGGAANSGPRKPDRAKR